jgi:membrane-anchored glycerophosphoryl diester phosphodiesterase (GDPDase)
LGSLSSLLDPAFFTGGYGAALLTMITIWFTLIVTAAILTFYLRPRVVVKLPYNATRQQVEGSRTDAVKYANWMKRLARYNVIVSMVAIVIGGFLRFGGFPF